MMTSQDIDNLKEILTKTKQKAQYWHTEAERWRDVANVVDDRIEAALADLTARVEHLERKLKQRTDIEL